MKNILVTICLLALGWGVKFGWNLITAEEYVEPTAAEWAAEEDAWIQESLADGSSAPARGWFDDANNGTFEGHPPTMKDLVERLHDAGAEEVWMVYIEEFMGKQLSDTIAVELPAPGPERDAVFAIYDELWAGEGSQDVGQQYLALSFD